MGTRRMEFEGARWNLHFILIKPRAGGVEIIELHGLFEITGYPA